MEDFENKSSRNTDRYSEVDLVHDFSKLTGQSLDVSRTYVMSVFELIKDKLRDGEPVVISNFGKFKVSYMKPVTKRLSGRDVKIGGYYTPAMVYSKNFRNEIHNCTERIDQYLEENENKKKER